tara:strand:+ start:197 stop:685 length:489 start_codon:yes stop_codon:yes gene_type:complete
MLNCRKCEFLIKPSMRHAMMNNCCPSCGSAILGDTYIQRMKLFKQRILAQEFSQKLSDDTIFDITLFMLMEFSAPDAAGLSDKEEPLPEGEPEESLDNVENHTDGSEDYEKIREEIREEVLSSPEASEDEADEDLKIARLKRLAKESKVRLSGASVRRLGGD